MKLDLDAYFRRIGYAGDRAATLETLNAIAYRHAAAIPFENLNPFLGERVELDLTALQQKLVRSQRGGYCFEHNLLLRAVLLELGYEVTPLAARVLWGTTTDVITPRSHMLLQVRIPGVAGDWLVDVGFGGVTLTGAIRLVRDVEQATPHEPFRLGNIDGDFSMQARVGDTWRSTYRFDLQRQYPVDYEAPNWYLSTSPRSHFVTGLIAARPAVDRRYALDGWHLAVHHLDGPTERRTLDTSGDLIESLERDFLIELPDWTPLEKALNRLS